MATVFYFAFSGYADTERSTEDKSHGNTIPLEREGDSDII